MCYDECERPVTVPQLHNNQRGESNLAHYQFWTLRDSPSMASATVGWSENVLVASEAELCLSTIVWAVCIRLAASSERSGTGRAEQLQAKIQHDSLPWV
jgi:hypothetical protein